MELKLGLMEADMKVITKKERNTDKVFNYLNYQEAILGMMDLNILANGQKIKFQDMYF